MILLVTFNCIRTQGGRSTIGNRHVMIFIKQAEIALSGLIRVFGNTVGTLNSFLSTFISCQNRI